MYHSIMNLDIFTLQYIFIIGAGHPLSPQQSVNIFYLAKSAKT